MIAEEARVRAAVEELAAELFGARLTGTGAVRLAIVRCHGCGATWQATS